MFPLSKISFVSALALVPFAAAQASAATGILAIEAHFKQAHIVPDLLESFTPSALLSLNFPGLGDVTPGQLLKKEQVGPTPTVTVTPANNTVSLTGTYTLAMVDADVVGASLAAGETRHWLVNGVTVENNVVKNDTAVGITTYAGPWPAAGSGPHRYIVALYEQPATFTAPAAFSKPNMGVSTFDFNLYVTESGLGPLVAANYINVEEGTASASLVATSAVVSSTLAPASTPAASGSNTKLSTIVGSASASAGAPAASSPASGAVGLTGAFSGVLAAAGVVIAAIMM